MIVIPMAGLSRRFALAGYRQPKHRLEAHGRTLFAHAVGSFAALFAREAFLFVCRAEDDTPAFVREQVRALGIQRAEVVVLDAPTRGQAETVQLGLEAARVPDGDPVLIFNIDTFRPGFSWPDDVERDRVDGYLEVFDGSGSQWSFVRPHPDGSNRVVETTEKRPISTLCCTGLYWFARAALFREAYAAQRAAGDDSLHAGEIYVAPLYNFLIGRGADIRYHRIAREEVIFCGVPEEYDAFRAAPAR